MSPTRHSWRNMVAKCTNENHVDYDRYGRRGITVCCRWLEFDKFLEDMGERPHDGRAYLARIDWEKGFEPGNVEWRPPAKTNNAGPHLKRKWENFRSKRRTQSLP